MTRPTFDAAVVALRDALKAAIDDPTFDRNDLSEVWRHYQGLQTITVSQGALRASSTPLTLVLWTSVLSAVSFMVTSLLDPWTTSLSPPLDRT